MSSLRDIKAECERDKSRVDSQHERVDRFSSETDSGEGSSTPAAPRFPSPYAPPRRGLRPAVAAAVILVVAAMVLVPILVFVVLPGGESPTDVYKEYVDASNDRDVKRMFDQTVTQFNPDYEQRLENLSNTVFFLDPEIDIVDLGVTYGANMSELQELTAQTIIDDIETELQINVDDYCYVHYSVNVHYREIDQTASFDGEVLCVNVDGKWLLAVPGYY
jgi:hypothetical protein